MGTVAANELTINTAN